MKFTIKCLEKYLKNNSSINENSNENQILNVTKIAETLTNLGFPVEDIEQPNEYVKNLRIAKIIKKNTHPNNPDLGMLEVEFLSNHALTSIQVICGDTSLQVGDHAVLILVDEIVPSTGKKLKPRAISGIESPGMLCSSEELCLPSASDGVKVLRNVTIHTPVTEALYPNGAIMDAEVTYNRGDLLCVKGIARELNAAGTYEFAVNNSQNIQALQTAIALDKKIDLKTKNMPSTMQYAIFAEYDYKNTIEISDEIYNTLNTLGKYTGHSPVDIGNYIMHHIGQPMHIFDADTIIGNIVIRESKAGEEFIGINEKTYILPDGLLVIADDKGVISVPGVMGGLRTAYSDQTKKLLVESAIIDIDTITLAVQALNLNTDASKLFTHGIDTQACEEAAALFAQLSGLKPNAVTRTGIIPSAQKDMKLSKQLAKEVLYTLWDEDKFQTILPRLGFKVTHHDQEQITFSVPTHRHDIDCEHVLLTEYVRLVGYDNILQTKLPIQPSQPLVKKSISAFLSQTLHEVRTYKFVSADNPNACAQLAIKNPMSGAGAMRKDLLPSLIEVFEENFKTHHHFAGVYEISQGFDYVNDTPIQHEYIGIVLHDKDQISWPAKKQDLHYLQVLIQQLLTQMGIDASKLKYQSGTHTESSNSKSNQMLDIQPKPYYMIDGMWGEIYWKKTLIGTIGQLQHSLKQNVAIYGAQLDLDALKQCAKFAKTQYNKDVKIYTKDFSIKADENTTAGSILEAIAKKYPQYQFSIFDVYKENYLQDRTIGIRAHIYSTETYTQEQLKEIYTGIENTLTELSKV